MAPSRRASDVEQLPAHTLRQLTMTEEERIALRDALHLALEGWKRRAGDEKRWRGLLEKIGEQPKKISGETIREA
jgi:hypothetical protein